MIVVTYWDVFPLQLHLIIMKPCQLLSSIRGSGYLANLLSETLKIVQINWWLLEYYCSYAVLNQCLIVLIYGRIIYSGNHYNELITVVTNQISREIDHMVNWGIRHTAHNTCRYVWLVLLTIYSETVWSSYLRRCCIWQGTHNVDLGSGF